MDPGQRKNLAKSYADRITASRKVLEKLDLKMLETLLRRSEESAQPDSLPSGGSEGPGGTAESTATESAALRGLPGADPKDGEVKPDDWDRHKVPDPVRELVYQMLAEVTELCALADVVTRKWTYIQGDYERQAARASKVTPCQRCERTITHEGEDRPRAGYCPRCHRAWGRAGYPDRLAFERSYEPTEDDETEDTVIVKLPNSFKVRGKEQESVTSA